MRKKIKFLTVATLVARNANEAIGGGGGGLALSAFGGNLQSGVRRSVLCWCIWQESGFSRLEGVFTCNLVKL
jgi:hypothetical protein